MLYMNLMTKRMWNTLKARRFRENHRVPVQKEAMALRVEANKKYRGRFPKKYQIMNRISNLKRAGWTIEKVDECLKKQRNSCAICHTSFESVKMHADHEHSIPPISRELLCGLCNKGLGQFLDSPERLESAAMYLRKWGK
jgi:hypothetical protein